MYKQDESYDTLSIHINNIHYLYLSKDSIVLNYDHMIPIDGETIKVNNNQLDMKTSRVLGNYGKFIDTPINECYYSLQFYYSDNTQSFCLSDSSFLQLCIKNGNSCMECRKIGIQSIT